MGGTWRLEGYDAFSDERYALTELSGVQPEYGSYPEALTAARKRLAELESVQPAAASGGQAEVQDRVYIIHPDGIRERVRDVIVPAGPPASERDKYWRMM